MAAYRRVYDSRHLLADCQEPGSAPEPYALVIEYGLPLPFLSAVGCSRGASIAFSDVRLFVGVCLFVRAAERKQLELLITKIGRYIVNGRPSACTDPKVKRSRLRLGVRLGLEMADRRGPACRYGSTVVEFDVGSNVPNCMSGWLIAANVAPRLLRAYQRLQLGVKRAGHEY